jgi:hypothetical protein
MAVRPDRQSGFRNASQRCTAGVRSFFFDRLRGCLGFTAAGSLYQRGRPVPGPFRIALDASFNASASWTSGVNSSDFQDFPDGGIVRGVAGGEAGIIFQDQAIRRMSYVPGSPIIFQIDRITQDKGLYAPYSIIRAGERIFFYAGQGFHKIDRGACPSRSAAKRSTAHWQSATFHGCRGPAKHASLLGI